MSAPRPPAELAAVFAALGDPTRLHLLALLSASSSLSIAELTAGTALSRQAVTKHLQQLAAAGLVQDVKLGRERLWRLEPTPLDEARRSLDAIGRQWDQALGRLKRMLDG